MGYSTDYVGCVVIDPPLNHAEQQYLTAFCVSRRFDRVDGPYAVPGNPAAEADPPPTVAERYNRVAPGQPAFHSGWIPDLDGARRGVRRDGGDVGERVGRLRVQVGAGAFVDVRRVRSDRGVLGGGAGRPGQAHPAGQRPSDPHEEPGGPGPGLRRA